jgi:hypothetical protein
MKCPKCHFVWRDEEGTNPQNRAFHALLTEYYKTGLHSAPERYTLGEFKIYMKLMYGPTPYELEYNGRTVQIPKSWKDFTKAERRQTIDGLMAEIFQVVHPLDDYPKLVEIIEGMQKIREEM